MAETVLLPRQGNSVESCIILEWKKNEGDTVSEGETICEVETDKATFEVETTASGTLRKQLVSEGDDVPVLAPIAVVAEPEEDIATLLEEAGSSAPAGSTGGEADSSAGQESPASGPGEPAQKVSGPSGSAGRAGAAGAGKEAGVAGGESAAPAAAADESAPVSPGVSAASGAGAAGAVSPRARLLARDKGIDPSLLSGSGPGGRVIERDVLAADHPGGIGSAAPEGAADGGDVYAADGPGQTAPAAAAAAATGAAEAAPPYPGTYEEIPVKSVRKVIAERMRGSLRETAQLTLHRRADARGLLAYRKRLKESSDEELRTISINDLIMYVVSRALGEFPEMNSHFLGESIRRFAGVHLGFAVDTDRGLMVPTIAGAGQRSLRDLAREAKRLAKLALEGKAGPEELKEGTFTVTNLGNLGIDYFTPVLNPPQVGILGVGAILPYPASIKEPDQFIPQIALSLTIDHQGIDGAPAARFLDRLSQMLSEIELVLAG